MPAPKKDKAIILLSSGLDSSVNLVQATQQMEVLLALTFDYGQMAAGQEISAARALSRHYAVPHKVVDIKWFNDFSGSALNLKQSLPLDLEISIDDKGVSTQSAQKVWVPNRNGIFLNIAAGYAEGLGANFVIPGFNKEEASTFPDNSQEFLETLNQSFFYSTEKRVQVKCFTTELDKSEIVALGKQLGLEFSKLWPCYQNKKHWCGACESCQRFKRALSNQGLSFEDLQSHSGGSRAV